MHVVTPEDVRQTTFATALPGQRGYHVEDVDDFLDRLEAALAGRATLTVAELRQVSFRVTGWWKRGYRADRVDAFVDRVRAEFGFH